MTLSLAKTVKRCRKDNAASRAAGQWAVVVSCCGLLASVLHVQTNLDACADSAVGNVISTGGVDNTGNHAGAMDGRVGGTGRMCNKGLTGACSAFVLCNARRGLGG